MCEDTNLCMSVMSAMSVAKIKSLIINVFFLRFSK